MSLFLQYAGQLFTLTLSNPQSFPQLSDLSLDYFFSFSGSMGRASSLFLFFHGIEHMLILYLQFFYFAVEGGHSQIVIPHIGMWIFGSAGFDAADIVFKFADGFLFCFEDPQIVQFTQLAPKLASVATAAVSHF